MIKDKCILDYIARFRKFARYMSLGHQDRQVEF